MKKHGRTLNAHYLVKEANLKKAIYCMIQLYDIPKKAKLCGEQKDLVAMGWMMGRRMNEESTENF